MSDAAPRVRRVRVCYFNGWAAGLEDASSYLGRIFDQDLKSEYDPEGSDATIELIVQRIERGELPVAERSARTAKAQAKLEKRKARLYKKYGLVLEPTTAN